MFDNNYVDFIDYLAVTFMYFRHSWFLDFNAVSSAQGYCVMFERRQNIHRTLLVIINN